MKYRIAWRSKLTGYEGHGEYIFATLEEAQDAADYANKHWLGIEH